MYICSTCKETNFFEDMCGNAKKKIKRYSNLVCGTLRCKVCEKNDQQLRYYAGINWGFGANASKNKQWTSLPRTTRWELRETFRGILEQNFGNDLESYKSYADNCLSSEFVNPLRIADRPPELHPMLSFVREKHKEQLAELENKQVTIKEGFIYVIVNPVWPLYCKIGCAIDYIRRLNSYQTGDPLRAYQLAGTAYVVHRKIAEDTIHAKLDDLCIGGEWFRITKDSALEYLEQIAEQINQSIDDELEDVDQLSD